MKASKFQHRLATAVLFAIASCSAASSNEPGLEFSSGSADIFGSLEEMAPMGIAGIGSGFDDVGEDYRFEKDESGPRRVLLSSKEVRNYQEKLSGIALLIFHSSFQLGEFLLSKIYRSFRRSSSTADVVNLKLKQLYWMMTKMPPRIMSKTIVTSFSIQLLSEASTPNQILPLPLPRPFFFTLPKCKCPSPPRQPSISVRGGHSTKLLLWITRQCSLPLLLNGMWE